VETVEAFRNAYADPYITSDEIFHYVYGLLHHPAYRGQYAGELRRMLARIPFVKDFQAVTAVGRSRRDLHLEYESIDPWPLTETVSTGAPEDPFERYRVDRMRHPSRTIRDKVIVNPNVTLGDIPAEAHEYMLNGKSALGWVLDRYRVRADPDSKIISDPNDWAVEQGDPRYIVDLVGRVVSLSIRTLELMEELPPFELLDGSAGQT
jgi:predicted helicase